MSFRPGTVVLCQYIKANGIICRSPALRGHCFCYFHQRWHDQRMLRTCVSAVVPALWPGPDLAHANPVSARVQVFTRGGFHLRRLQVTRGATKLVRELEL